MSDTPRDNDQAPAPDGRMPQEKLDELLSADPKNAGLLKERASWRLLEQDWAGVIEDFEAILSLAPQACFEGKLAAAYARSGDAPAAEKEFARELGARGDDPHLLWSRADFRHDRNDLHACYEDLLKASRLLPHEPSIWAALSKVEAELGKFEDALEHIARSLQGSPGYWPYLLSRGVLRFRMSKWSEAEEDFNAVLDLISDNESCRHFCQQAYRHRGWARFLQSQDGALEDLHKAVSLDPLDTLALCYRGVVRCSKRDKEARSDFDSALRIDPGLAMAYAFRGDFLLHLADDREAALEDYKKALALEPELKEVVERARVGLTPAPE